MRRHFRGGAGLAPFNSLDQKPHKNTAHTPKGERFDVAGVPGQVTGGCQDQQKSDDPETFEYLYAHFLPLDVSWANDPSLTAVYSKSFWIEGFKA